MFQTCYFIVSISLFQLKMILEFLIDFYNNTYLPMRYNAENIDFSQDGSFDYFAKLMNQYDIAIL